MAVVATMLAGLSSSEMNRAQYARSLGAQQQSKAGDQWSFFQAKRLRGALQRNAMDLLQNTTEVRALDAGALRLSVQQLPHQSGSPEVQAEAAQLKRELTTLLDSTTGQQTLVLLTKGAVPPVPPAPVVNPKLKAAIDGIENLSTDAEMAALLAPVDDAMVLDALRNARDQAQAFDVATKPFNQAIDQLDALLSRDLACLEHLGGAGAGLATVRALNRDFAAARLRYASQRYEIEGRLNQAIANFYELQVRKSNISAERHHRRSQRFFFGMLGAQLGVIIATFAMAARQRNLLWSLAAGAGVLAVAFAVYVYLYM
jgi:hypothetical protein